MIRSEVLVEKSVIVYDVTCSVRDIALDKTICVETTTVLRLSDIGNIRTWNVSQFTDTSYMFFESCLTKIGDLSKWKLSKITNTKNMFNESTLDFEIINNNIAKK